MRRGILWLEDRKPYSALALVALATFIWSYVVIASVSAWL